jgi:hypothetical protein
MLYSDPRKGSQLSRINHNPHASPILTIASPFGIVVNPFRTIARPFRTIARPFRREGEVF